MIKVNRFCIGKNKCYKGISIRFFWFKFERIGFKDKFLWRIEFTNWR